jgi:hypothetical protein
MVSNQVLRQRTWTEPELRVSGFTYYEPRKRLVMARVVRQSTNIELTLETLMADAGDIVCYDPGTHPRPELDDYDHWPVQRSLFKETYRPWDDPAWRPNPAEAHLMLNNCRPYYKWVGIWALKLPISIYVQSLESPEPAVVPKGRWLCIGSQGEPYNMSDESIRARYLIP